MTIITVKPDGLTFYNIGLSPNVGDSPRKSFQEQYYQPQSYSIKKEGKTGDYHLKNANPSLFSIENAREYAVYPFVIINRNNELALIIGQANHDIIAEKAKSVAAAGDIYVLLNSSKIFKVTDQSGSYYIRNDDPLAEEKRISARTAMKVVGLPMHLFEPFAKLKPLIFNDKLRTCARDFFKEKEETAERPRLIELKSG